MHTVLNTKYSDLRKKHFVSIRSKKKKKGIHIVKRKVYNSISASFILHLHCASSVSHCIHSLSSKVNGSSLAAYATVWLRGVALSTLAQQHAYITVHVLGVIQSASVYSGVITRLS